jgi:hypothetical protein
LKATNSATRAKMTVEMSMSGIGDEFLVGPRFRRRSRAAHN